MLLVGTEPRQDLGTRPDSGNSGCDCRGSPISVFAFSLSLSLSLCVCVSLAGLRVWGKGLMSWSDFRDRNGCPSLHVDSGPLAIEMVQSGPQDQGRGVRANKGKDVQGQSSADKTA